MRVYYNEFDKKKCAALSQLMKDGHIRKGEIDDRSITDVRGSDLKGYTRAHFFAGIGLWDHSLDLAGWDEDLPVWTGSCPCQPFSSAGRQKAQADDRHLWPEWERLIRECSPSTIFGEQVSSAITKGWLDDVYQGLEAQGYAVGSAVLPASAVGAPHRRERLWFVGNAEHNGSPPTEVSGGGKEAILDNAQEQNRTSQLAGTSEPRGVSSSTMGNASSKGPQGHGRPIQEPMAQGREGAERHTWSSGVWLDCPDGKKRLVEPRIPLLVDGYSERVGIIHCAGDAIVPQVAATFVEAFLDT